MKFYARGSGADQSHHRRFPGELAIDRARCAGGSAAAAPTWWCFPELALTGYPPRDLVEKPSFLTRSEMELEKLARETADLDLSLIVGFVARSQAETGKRALNSAAVIRARPDRVPAEQDAAAQLRRFRRGALLPPRGARGSVHHRRPQGRADHLRRRLERSPVLEAAPVHARSGGGVVRRGRGGDDLRQRLALQMGKREVRRSIYRSAARRYRSRWCT